MSRKSLDVSHLKKRLKISEKNLRNNNPKKTSATKSESKDEEIKPKEGDYVIASLVTTGLTQEEFISKIKGAMGKLKFYPSINTGQVHGKIIQILENEKLFLVKPLDGGRPTICNKVLQKCK